MRHYAPESNSRLFSLHRASLREEVLVPASLDLRQRGFVLLRLPALRRGPVAPGVNLSEGIFFTDDLGVVGLPLLEGEPPAQA
jgi:hypothetical protein